MRHDWVVNRANEIKRLAKLYQNSKAVFRELVTNSLDAYGRLEQENLKNGITQPVDKIIKLVIPTKADKERHLVCIDYATGIMSLKEFAMLFDSSKADEDISAGEFGIGKLSCFGITVNLNGRLIYISNNGDTERILRVDTAGYDDEEPVSSAKGKLKRRGCVVYIYDLNMDTLPTPKQVIAYLSNTFAVRLVKDRSIKLTVNNELVTIPKEFEPYRKAWPILTTPNLTIEGSIIGFSGGTGSLWVSKKGIRIGNGPKDLGLDYRIKGWIDCSQLELTPDRNNIMEDQTFTMVQDALRAHCEQGNFRKIESDSDDSQVSPLKTRRLIDKMTGLLESLVSNSNFKDRFAMPTILMEQKKEVEVDIFDHPEIKADIERIKAKMAKYQSGNTTLTGGTGSKVGSMVDGFDASGHTKPINTGSGTGIHTEEQINSGGKTPVIRGPEKPIKTPGTSPWAGVPPVPGQDFTSVQIAGQQQQAEKIKQMMTVEVRRPGGFEFVEIPYGDGRPPMFVKDNRIILNTSNKIFRASIKHELGYAAMYSIALSHLYRDYEEVDQYQRDAYIFEILRHILKQMGYL